MIYTDLHCGMRNKSNEYILCLNDLTIQKENRQSEYICKRQFDNKINSAHEKHSRKWHTQL